MEYAIDKHIPTPRVASGRPVMYPFAKLKVGESFFVPGMTSTKFGSTRGYHARKLRRTFTARNLDGGVRVWRTA